MSDYSIRTGGALKLKSSSSDGKVKKKKATKSTLDKERVRESIENGDVSIVNPEEDVVASGTVTPNPNPAGPSTGGGGKTKAEKRFEEVQRKRLLNKVAKMAKSTHKDRVHEFNAKLEALSEHHDIPKVGPG